MLRNYSNDLDAIRRFVVEYAKVDDNIKVCPYVESMKAVANRTSSTFLVELDHLAEFDEELCEAVENNTMRYQKIFATTVDSMLPDYRDPNLIVKDALDVYVEQRIMSSAAHNTPAAATGSLSVGLSSVEENEQRSRFPPELLRRYEVSFSGRIDSKPLAVRDVLACKIGHLVQLRGVVTRAAEVKPLLRVATYTCDQCGTETYQEIPNPTFMPLSTCMNEACKAERNTAGGRLHLQTRGSKFLKFQELKVQELAEQVPVGNIPRSMSVYCRGENTRIVQPGDHVQLTGVFLPAVRSGFKQIAQGLLADTYLEAHRVQLVSQGNEVTDDGLVELTERELECLQDPDYFGTMARSLAPEIYGHEDIKKALLLMLVGGVDLSPRGMKIRGSINICLMGDPGVAKSQLLGFVHRLASRSQYTTGRGSSGVGLTAAIVKDTLTGEMTLEGGALVLADQGVCCIDEFDKMAEFDRTAIHEVMEQQTISIAKAGILTTLNARVSILAAANPAFGRYNPRKSVEQNVDLPAALLSRFDLLWLIQDKPDREHDLRLAQHIAYVHTHNTAPQTHTASVKGGLGNNETTTAQADEVLTMVQLRRLIQACRQLPPPSVPKALSDYLIGAYVELRKEARNNREMTYTSARTLLAILRLSTALARLRVSNEVSKYDIDEAMRLMEASRSSVQINDVAGANTWSNRGLTYRDHIYQVVRDMSCTLSPGSGALRVADIMERCAAKGFKPDQVNEVLDNYENLNVWHLNAGRSRLTMVN